MQKLIILKIILMSCKYTLDGQTKDKPQILELKRKIKAR